MHAIKSVLASEGFTMMEIQTQLNGSDVARTLGQKCRKSYIAPPDDDAVAGSVPHEDFPHP